MTDCWRKENKDAAKQTLIKQPVFGHLEAALLLGWCSLDRRVCVRAHTHRAPGLEFRLPRLEMKWSVDSLACHRKQWAAAPHVAGRTGQGGADGGVRGENDGNRAVGRPPITWSHHATSARLWTREVRVLCRHPYLRSWFDFMCVSVFTFNIVFNMKMNPPPPHTHTNDLHPHPVCVNDDQTSFDFENPNFT